VRYVFYENHTIKIGVMVFMGRLVIIYDEEEIYSANLKSIVGKGFGFDVREGSMKVRYFVEVGLKTLGLKNWVTVKRNGDLIYSDR